jgi:hypothetical protein
MNNIFQMQLLIYLYTGVRENYEETNRTLGFITSLRDLYLEGVTFCATNISSLWDCPIRDPAMAGVESKMKFTKSPVRPA